MLSFENGIFHIPETGLGNGVLSFEFENETVSTESAVWISSGGLWETELKNDCIITDSTRVSKINRIKKFFYFVCSIR